MTAVFTGAVYPIRPSRFINLHPSPHVYHRTCLTTGYFPAEIDRTTPGSCACDSRPRLQSLGFVQAYAHGARSHEGEMCNVIHGIAYQLIPQRRMSWMYGDPRIGCSHPHFPRPFRIYCTPVKAPRGLACTTQTRRSHWCAVLFGPCLFVRHRAARKPLPRIRMMHCTSGGPSTQYYSS